MKLQDGRDPRCALPRMPQLCVRVNRGIRHRVGRSFHLCQLENPASFHRCVHHNRCPFFLLHGMGSQTCSLVGTSNTYAVLSNAWEVPWPACCLREWQSAGQPICCRMSARQWVSASCSMGVKSASVHDAVRFSKCQRYSVIQHVSVSASWIIDELKYEAEKMGTFVSFLPLSKVIQHVPGHL